MPSPPPPDETFHYRRSDVSLWLVGLGFAPFAAAGIYMSLRGPLFLGLFLLLVGGAGVCAFLLQLRSPSAVARITADGVMFPFHRPVHIPWAIICDAHVGPRIVNYSDGTNFKNRDPLLLVLDASTQPEPFRNSFDEDFVRLPDGSYRLLIDTTGFPLSTADLAARIRARLPSASAAQKSSPNNNRSRV